MSGKADFYKLLNVEPYASMEDIKQAYRKLALLHHPDRKVGQDTQTSALTTPSTSTFFQDVNEAYDVLSDPEKRTEYDLKHYGMSTFASAINPANIGAVKNDGYKRMTSEDVNRLLANANALDRMTTADYQRSRSTVAPHGIGRRATDFAERKAFRGRNTPLPSQNATFARLAVPAIMLVVCGIGLNSMWSSSKKVRRSNI
ncbi:hypothetical protein LEN26_007897 [Aphanomyces euteiches]|nr:hypothetical protein AeMF1_003793 [Aphanomyces euteiches]KAH9131132.1 hypothetical protein LEN26_007897 [Aphanomyces euteiches]KAH9189137.1 hypothetical protein AeNC1_008880 [Aphanomyces euteiches]